MPTRYQSTSQLSPRFALKVLIQQSIKNKGFYELYEDTSVQIESNITYFDAMFNVGCTYKREFDQSLNHDYNNITVGITLDFTRKGWWYHG